MNPPSPPPHPHAPPKIHNGISFRTTLRATVRGSIRVTCIPVSTLTPGPSTRDSGRWPLTEYTRTSKIQRLESLEVLEGTGQIAGSSGADIAPWVLRDAVGLQVDGRARARVKVWGLAFRVSLKNYGYNLGSACRLQGKVYGVGCGMYTRFCVCA